MFKKYYLAYGSNLNLEQMNYRCWTANPLGVTLLKDYRLVYKGKADFFAYLTIERCKGYNVPLGVFEVLPFDMFSLDNYEGYPTIYKKTYIPLEIDGKKKKAFIYIMNENFTYHLPSRRYIETCEKGYNHFGFDKTILDIALRDTFDEMDFRRIRKKENK